MKTSTTLKIQYVSDLHLEFPQNRSWLEEHPLEVTGDILLIAGDTAYLDTPKSGQDSYTRYSFWDWAAEHYRQVIVCFGNHDFYVIQGRHDVCALPRAVVLVEALAAMVTVDEMMLANMQ